MQLTAHHILNTGQIKTLEALSDANSTGYKQLMNNAGQAVADVILQIYSPGKVLVLCGSGNNGGDGFVAALALKNSKLKKLGWSVDVAANGSVPDGLSAEALFYRTQWGNDILDMDTVSLEGYDLIVDGLFGTGLSRNIDGKIKELIERVNNSHKPVISIDIPSGIHTDTGEILGISIKAETNVTFGYTKPGHHLLPGKMYCGHIICKDIGLPTQIDLEAPETLMNDPGLWKERWVPPFPLDHKYTRGHVLLLGSNQMTGASRLAALAARRSGCGILTIGCAPEVFSIYASDTPGNIIQPLASKEDFINLIHTKSIRVILIGSGLPPSTVTSDAVLRVLETGKLCVLDAGALTTFEQAPEVLLAALHKNCILTPHAGEFSRLFPNIHGSKIERARQAAQQAGCTVLIKGSDTVIASLGGTVVVQTNAPPTLASAGTGDVLAGIIAGLFAQTQDPFLSANAGCWIHAEAANQIGLGLIAEDLPLHIPDVMAEVFMGC